MLYYCLKYKKILRVLIQKFLQLVMVEQCFALNYKMNDTINKFLLVGDKFMPEMHLKQPGHLLRIKKEYKSLNKLEIRDIFTETN